MGKLLGVQTVQASHIHKINLRGKARLYCLTAAAVGSGRPNYALYAVFQEEVGYGVTRQRPLTRRSIGLLWLFKGGRSRRYVFRLSPCPRPHSPPGTAAFLFGAHASRAAGRVRDHILFRQPTVGLCEKSVLRRNEIEMLSSSA
jgi:hypothetical protein